MTRHQLCIMGGDGTARSARTHPQVCTGRRDILPHVAGNQRGAGGGTVWEEADECVDWLEYLRDMEIAQNDVLSQEALELARIFAKSVKTARAGGKYLKVERGR